MVTQLKLGSTEARVPYVSDQLTHFIGRGLSETDQYGLLLRIIENGYLTSRPELRAKGVTLVAERGKAGAPLSSNELYDPDMVCFCDIPLSDLAVHMGKYSRFGLAFEKEFVARQGGCPVRYVPRQTLGRWRTHEIQEALYKELVATGEIPDPEEASRRFREVHEEAAHGLVSLADVFDTSLPEYEKLVGPQAREKMIAEHKSQGEPGTPPDFFRYMLLDTFLRQHFFSFLKFFDIGLAQDDPNNFYMEREWRIVGELNFDPADVATVILPSGYDGRFKSERPTLADRTSPV